MKSKSVVNDAKIWMQRALEIATASIAKGEVPVGALVVSDGQLISWASNEKEGLPSPVAHAELLALHRAAKRLGRWRLSGCSLYVTLEPCPMCAGAIVNSRIDHLYYGASDPKSGAISSLYQICTDTRLNHQVKIEAGLLRTECEDLLKTFFKKRREQGKKQLQ